METGADDPSFLNVGTEDRRSYWRSGSQGRDTEAILWDAANLTEPPKNN